MPDATSAVSLYAVAMRVTRLDAAGKPLVGPDNLVVTHSMVRLDFTPTYSETDAVEKRNGRGKPCLNVRSKRTISGVEVTVEVCEDDAVLAEMLGGGTVLTSGAGADIIGYQLPKDTDPDSNGVSIEVWTEAWAGDSRVADLPYFRYLFPKVTLSPTERTLAAEPGEVAFEGSGGQNAQLGRGVAGDWAPDSGAAMQWIRTATAPPAATNGYAAVAAPA